MRYLILALLLLVAPAVSAQTITESHDGGGSCGTLNAGDRCYYKLTNSAAADSAAFSAAAEWDMCFDPDVGSEGASTAQVTIRRVIGPTADADNSGRITTDDDAAGTYGDGILTGADGSVLGAQKMCIYGIRPGIYYIDVITAPGSGETGYVELVGMR